MVVLGSLSLMEVQRMKWMMMISRKWLASLPKGIYYCYMLEVILKGSPGQTPWGKFSCHFRIWQLMTLMGQSRCFLIIYLQLLLVQDKLLKMKVICFVYCILSEIEHELDISMTLTLWLLVMLLSHLSQHHISSH